MKYTAEKVAEAKRFGWDINPKTGDWSAECIVCGEHKVLPVHMYCQDCIDLHTRRKEMEVTFKSWTCDAIGLRYHDGSRALRLLEVGTGEPIATCTLNIPELPLEDSDVLIKNYSENIGMVEALQEAGIIDKHIATYSNEYDVEFPVYQLTEAARWLWDEEVDKEVNKHKEAI
jgi:hypothetical protein